MASNQCHRIQQVPTEEAFFAPPAESADFNFASFVVIQAPFEATVSYGAGTANAPAAILKASKQVEFYDEETGTSAVIERGVCTTKPLNCECDGEEINRRVFEIARQIVDAGKVPILIGGEHTVSYGAVRACKEKHPDLSVLQFDAHSDLRDTYMGQKWNHATAGARINELCPIVQVGVRSREKADEGVHPERPVHCFPAHRYRTGGAWYDEAIAHFGRDVYITVDVDAFDPGVMPGTGTPEPGGLDWWTIVDLIRRTCAERRVVGFDIVEAAPIPGSQATEFAAARLISKIINYIGKYSME